MKLQQALNVQRGDVVSFIGAGGKTSALFRLSRELSELGWRVVCTTTTRIAEEELAQAMAQLHISEPALRPEAISRLLTAHGSVFLHTRIEGGNVYGLHTKTIDALIDAVDSDVILIEADGARNLPFKAPYAHEPLIPPCATLVVPVAGYDSIGQPLDADHVYNPEAMIERYGYLSGDNIKGPWVASVLRDEELGLKNVPDRARIVALLNKVPYTRSHRVRARIVSKLILRQNRISAVAIGSVQEAHPILESQRRIAAIVLAAGLSSRMGKMKVLLPWEGGRPIIRVIVDRLKRLRLDDLVVVTGHLAAQVAGAIDQEPARIVHNKEYREGDMLSSLKAGLRALGPEIAAAMIVLGDQPQLDNRVVHQVMNAYVEGRGLIVAPSYKERRGHPILIDRSFWNEILDLPPGGSPRDVINAHADQIYYVNVDTDSVLRDIDTPQDYEQERKRAGLG
ncbi:MAG: putative selenium-dependent hydroxylase accessory protein YqeC [Anaerolineae bacterium]|nr:putative selenium-dependent hydroxylase accessory protein YqeC [Anaerolineae bacterium]